MQSDALICFVSLNSNLPEAEAHELFDRAVSKMWKDGTRLKEVHGHDSENFSS